MRLGRKKQHSSGFYFHQRWRVKICVTLRVTLSRVTSWTRHTTVFTDFTGAAGWQRFSYFRFIQIVVSSACESGSRRGRAVKPICYTWVFISHHTDRSLSIMDGLLAWRFQNTVSLQFLMMTSKKLELDHGACGKPQRWLLRWRHR